MSSCGYKINWVVFIIDKNMKNIKNINTTEKLDIENLVKRAKDGENEASKQLMERYKYLIIKESAKYHIPGYEFEDLVQHGYLSILRAIHKYKGGSNSFDGYCIRAIKVNYIDLLKGKIKHYREVPDSTLIDLNEEVYEFTIEDEVIAYEETKRLYEALDKLSPEEREIINRFYIHNHSLKEIACDCNIDYFKVYRQKEKALESLRKLL